MKVEVGSVHINQIKVGERHRKDLGDIGSLMASIKEVGLLHPIVVDAQHNLIAGERRLEAFQRLHEQNGTSDYMYIPTLIARDIEDALKAIKAERDENVCRKDFTPTEAYTVGSRIKEIEAPAAKERQSTLNNQETACGNFPQADTGKTRDKVGEAVGVSGKTYEKIETVMEAAEAEPETYGDLPELMDTKSVDRAYKEFKDRERKKHIEVRRPAEPLRAQLYHGSMLDILPELGKFDLVVTDPPYGVTAHEWDSLHTQEWLEALIPQLSDEFNLFWFCSPIYAADIEIIFRDMDLPIQSRIVWHRRNMSMGSKARNRFVDSWEMILHAGNRELNFPEEWSEAWFDVQTFAVPQTNFTDTKYHPTQKPEGLIHRLVTFGSYPGDRVLDPFAGSGTTGAVCPPDRECVLIEREDEFVRVIEGRLGVGRI